MRLTLAAAAAVAVAVLLAAGYSYVSVRNQLRGQVDERLTDQVDRVGDVRIFRGVLGPVPDSPLAADQSIVQLVGADGSTTRPANQRGRIPVDARDRAVAAGRVEKHLRDATVNGEHVRVITVPASPESQSSSPIPWPRSTATSPTSACASSSPGSAGWPSPPHSGSSSPAPRCVLCAA